MSTKKETVLDIDAAEFFAKLEKKESRIKFELTEAEEKIFEMWNKKHQKNVSTLNNLNKIVQEQD